MTIWQVISQKEIPGRNNNKTTEGEDENGTARADAAVRLHCVLFQTICKGVAVIPPD